MTRIFFYSKKRISLLSMKRTYAAFINAPYNRMQPYIFVSSIEYTHFKEHLRLAIPVGRRVNFISLRWMSRKAARVTSKTIVRLYFTFRRKRDLCHVIRIIQYSFLNKKKKSHSHSYILHLPSLSLYSYYFFLRNSLYIFFLYSTDFIPTGVSRVRKINFFAGRMS